MSRATMIVRYGPGEAASSAKPYAATFDVMHGAMRVETSVTSGAKSAGSSGPMLVRSKGDATIGWSFGGTKRTVISASATPVSPTAIGIATRSRRRLITGSVQI